MGVILYSASDGPDLLSEELVLMRNMNSAVKQERYSEAGTSDLDYMFPFTKEIPNTTTNVMRFIFSSVMWREKLIKLRELKLEH